MKILRKMKSDLTRTFLVLVIAVSEVACGPSSSVDSAAQESSDAPHDSVVSPAKTLNAAAKRTSAYAFVFPFEEEAFKLFLVGEFDAGINLTLLDPSSKATCAAKTSTRRDTVDSSDAPLTELEGECLSNGEFGLAALETRVDDFAAVPLQVVDDPDKVQAVDAIVRGSKALNSLLTKAQDSSPGDISQLTGVTPTVHRLNVSNSEVYVASYQGEATYKQGVYAPEVNPRAVVVGNSAYPLTGWCSFEALNVFRLNGEHYIQSGSRCCGCGIVVDELFRLTPAGPVEVLSDSSLSD